MIVAIVLGSIFGVLVLGIGVGSWWNSKGPGGRGHPGPRPPWNA